MNAQTATELVKIPLSKLRPSPRNVRKTGGASIDDLAASILAHQLIQNLTVTPANDGFFEVEAGSRRLRAMQKLAAESKIPADYAVHCRVVTLAEAAEASLAENQLREAMHPADQFLAIKALVDAKLSEAEIAARFGVTPLFVRQRMKLAKVSPKIIEDYRAGKTTLDVVEACALTDDIPRQERAYKANRNWADGVRRALTQGEVEATDARAKFIGIEAYEAAGGPTHKDLFGDGTIYLRDVALLDRLVAEKLEAHAEKVRAEGWGWVEVGVDPYQFPCHHEEKGDKAKFGAVVHLQTWNGTIGVARWRMKKGQRAGAAGKAGQGKPKTGLSADMVRRLELHRAAAIRQHIAGDPGLALQLLLVQMLTALLTDSHATLVLGLTPRNVHNHTAIDIRGKFGDVGQSPARKALDERIAAWRKAGLPAKAGALPDWVASLTDAQRLELLALATALVFDHNEGPRGAVAAAQFNVDMRDWWKPTPEFYLTLVPKALLAEAVTEVAGKPAGEKLLTLKKDAAIAEAAKHLDGAGWLPKPLRHAGYEVRKALSGEAPAPAKKAQVVATSGDVEAIPNKRRYQVVATTKGKAKPKKPAKKAAVKKAPRKAPAKAPPKKKAGAKR